MQEKKRSEIEKERERLFLVMDLMYHPTTHYRPQGRRRAVEHLSDAVRVHVSGKDKTHVTDEDIADRNQCFLMILTSVLLTTVVLLSAFLFAGRQELER